MELPEVHPAEAFVARIISPGRGEAYVKFRQEIFDRQRQRVNDALAAAELESGLDRDVILERLTTDERLGDLLLEAVEVARKTQWKAKVRALGRVLAQGILADSDTAVDAADVLIRIVSQMDPPHARALAVIAQGGAFNPNGGTIGSTDALGDWLAEVFPGLGAVANEVGAFLDRYGLITNPFWTNGILAVTPLGSRLLELIADAQDGMDASA